MGVQLKRRTFLKAAGVGAGVAAVSYATKPAPIASALPTLQKAISPAERDRAWHILNRISFGPRPGDVDKLTQMGLTAYVKQQMDYTSINDDALQSKLANYDAFGLASADIRARIDAANNNKTAYPFKKDIDQQLVEATLVRSIYSERQLYEVMVQFWSEHFSIYISKGDCWLYKLADDRNVIRKNVFGKFGDLLKASAHSPAMLNYLDNESNEKAHPNENYAREIMELHTLGVGNYTEQDIKEVARCLTGWSIQRDPAQPGRDEFTFHTYAHDDGSKVVLGHQIPAGGGVTDGDTVLNILASHPKTAQFISLKLCRRFIGDNPPDRVVQKAAQAFASSGGDIPTVLMAIFSSSEFWYADPKYKRPYEYLVSLYRAFNIQPPTDWWGPAHELDILNHRPFNHLTPDGYSDLSVKWVGGVLMDRWNITIGHVGDKSNDKSQSLFQLAVENGAANTPQGVLDYYAKLMLGRPLQQKESDILLKYVSSAGSNDLTSQAGQTATIEAVTLLTNSPAYQYR